MKIKPTLALTSAVLMFAGTCVHAAPKQGDGEFSINAFLFASDSFELARGDVNYGYYMSPQLIGRIGAGVSGSTGGDSDITFDGNVGLHYNFSPTGSTVFMRVGANFPDVEEFTDLIDAETWLGYRNYLTESVAFDYQVGYRFELTGDAGSDSDAVVARMGVTIFF